MYRCHEIHLKNYEYSTYSRLFKHSGIYVYVVICQNNYYYVFILLCSVVQSSRAPVFLAILKVNACYFA